MDFVQIGFLGLLFVAVTAAAFFVLGLFVARRRPSAWMRSAAASRGRRPAGMPGWSAWSS